MRVVRLRLRRQPVASIALVLACAWIALNAYETVRHWSGEEGLGWFGALTTAVSLSTIGLVAIAALAWLVESVFRDSHS